MEINDFRIIGSLSERYLIEPLGDIHLGAVNCDKDKLQARINRIKNTPNCYTIIMGDIADAITLHDKRFDGNTVDPELKEPERQYEYAEEVLRPIKDKIIGIHTGNHDSFLRKETARMLRNSGIYGEDKILQESDWVKKLCKNLGVPHLSFSAFTRLTFQNPKKELDVSQFKIFSTHGRYGGERVGGNVNKVEDYASFFEADIYLSAHTHQIVSSKRVILTVSQRSRDIIERIQVFAVTGSFLRGYAVGNTSYVEESVKRPTRIGTITVDIQPNRRDIDVHE